MGYRAALQDKAQTLGITGWVRNRSDGSVEALVQGSPEAIDAIVSWAGRGPASARVSALEVARLDDAPACAQFEQRATL